MLVTRFLFITFAFLVISKISYTQVPLMNSAKMQSFDSISFENVAEKDSSQQSVFNTLSLIDVKFSLDSLNNIKRIMTNSLTNSPNLSLDTLLSFQKHLRSVQEKANDLGKLIKEHNTLIDTLGLGDQAINIYFKIGTLKGRVDDRIKKIENQAIKKEAGYIWTAPLTLKTNDLYRELKSSFKKTKSISTEAKTSEKGGILFLLLASLGYFYWLFKNKPNKNLVGSHNSSSIIESLLFLLVLLPFFDRGITTQYIEVIQLLILLLVFWKFKAYIEIQSMRWWLVIITLYILLLLINYLIMSNGFIVRIIAIGLNLIALNIGYLTVNRLKKINNYNRTYRIVFFIYVILNISAILLNIIGQVNVSKITSIAAIIGAVQLVGLIAFGKIIIENLNLLFAKTKKSKSFLANINEVKITSFIRKALFFIGSVLWLIVLMINLEIIGPVTELLNALLNRHHAFGSITFTLGNLIYCVVIIGIANWFQKNLDILLTDNKSKRFEPQITQQGTKITLLRLAIIILGFLLGVTALGISMNKLTVILGALSVGIGLGMQNIFNNFVSGVILIFEKPFKIGDYIELADKKGRVQKIGIRSSSLLTEQGSEVIIPNGDLLSGRLVNWTHSHSYYRCELIFKFNATSNLEQIKQIILDAIEKNTYAIKEGSTEILYNSISNTDFELIIKCWIGTIYNESQFKSSLLEELKAQLTDDEIISLGK